jgi:tripartite-type tricarboxylate transporter receptor subunit TctC
VTIWNGFFAPKGTPKEIVARLNQALVTAVSDEKVRARLTELAVELPTAQEITPEALRDQLKASIDKWVPAVRAAGVKPE